MSNTVKVKVMYIGSRKLRRDPIRRSGRLWHGPGSTVEMSLDEASKYLAYPGTFLDADSDDGKAFVRSPTKVGAVMPDPDEVVSETNPVEKGKAPTEDKVDLDDLDRGVQIKAAILSLKKTDFTAQGRPKIASVNTAAGFNVSADEVTEAMNDLRSEGKL